MSNQVKVISKVDRPLIPIDSTCERYICLNLRLPPQPQQSQDRLPLNLSLIIDRSGSMSGDKLAYVKEAAIHTLRLMGETDRVSVVIYDDEVEVIAPSTTLTSASRQDLIRRVERVTTGGMTNLSGGWFSGCDQIADHMTAAHLNRALLLTDGLANRGIVDQEELVFQAKELRRRSITTTTFGVGHDFNQFLLQGIADAGGGHFYFIDSPRQIPNYFQGELGELLATVVKEMTLDIGLPDGVTCSLLNDLPFEQNGDRLRLYLGDGYAGETRSLVFKVSTPPRPLGESLVLPLRLNYEDTLARRSVTLENQPVEFKVVSKGEAESQPANEEVQQEAGRLEAEKAKMEALKKEYQGDIVGAQTALRRAGAIISETFPAAPAQALMDELQELDKSITAGLTAQARKARHYATYTVQRSRKDYKE